MRYLYFLLLSCSLLSVWGQNFAIAPNDTIAAFISTDVLHVANINQIHLGTETLHLSWKQVNASVPNDWEASLCDFGHCYTDLPLMGTMDSLVAGDNGIMSLHVTPHLTSGIAFIQYEIWDEAFPLQKYLLTWRLENTSTDIASADLSSPFFWLAHNTLYIDNSDSDFSELSIIDLSGRIMKIGRIEDGKWQQDLSFLPRGCYLISFLGKKKNAVKKVWIND